MLSPAPLHPPFALAGRPLALTVGRLCALAAAVAGATLGPVAYGAVNAPGSPAGGPASAVSGTVASAAVSPAASAAARAAPADPGRSVSRVDVSESRTGEPKVERTLIEDDGTRIEEVRVRGQTRSIHVQPKGLKGAGYDIVPADPARDSAPGPSNGRGAAGQRVWSVWSF